MMQPLTRFRRALYRWTGWFFLINVLLSMVTAVGFIKVLPHFAAGASMGGTVLAWTFLVASFFTQYMLMFFLASVLIFILVTLFPRRWLVFGVSALSSTILNFALIADSLTFGLYRMHGFLIGWDVFKAGAFSQVFALSSTEKLFVVVGILTLLLIEYLIAFLVWRSIRKQEPRRRGYKVAAIFFVLFGASYGIMFMSTSLASRHWLSPANNLAILNAVRIVPLYNELYSLVVPGDSSMRKIATLQGGVDVQVRATNKPLDYPHYSLQCARPKQPLNVVLVTIDAWRYDAMNKKVTPHIDQFAKKTLQFQDHWSGGNATRPGIFSLFYGLPANYWNAFLSQQRGPVLMHQLLQDHYQMGIFASAALTFPAFHKTVFREITPLKLFTKGNTSVERDRGITKEFNQFVTNRNKRKPFFSFLFYDAVHNYCDERTPFQTPFQPAIHACDRFSLTADSDPIPYINRYRNAVHFVDGQVAAVLKTLKEQHVLKNTVVIITADHGEQLNDQHMNYWDHASAYTPYQLHVPFLLYWPGKNPKKYTYFTTHFDVAPTLMMHVLGCVSPVADYSTGRSLFVKGGRPYLIATSYSDYAIVTKKRITRIYPAGGYAINYPNGHPMLGAALDVRSLKNVRHDLYRYFK